MGNPAAFSYSHLFAALMASSRASDATATTSPSSSQDTSSRLIASQFLYGAPMSVPIPDLMRTDLLVMMGANPVVSHGSFLTAPRIKDRMHDIVKRGGRVVVVDPRRTETAAQFEWLGIVPDARRLLPAVAAAGHVRRGPRRLAARESGRPTEWIGLRRQSAPFTPEATAAAHRHRARDASARSHATSCATPRAAVYGRLGTCVGRNGTLTTYLIDAVNLVAGNLDAPGGSVFSTMRHLGQRWQFMVMGAVDAPVLSAEAVAHRRIPSVRSRAEPAALMAKEITTPGDRQIKAMFVVAGNPVLSVPNGDELEAAFETLDLSVAWTSTSPRRPLTATTSCPSPRCTSATTSP